MLRIMAPTDFSTDGYNATLVAMRIAQRFDSEVIFVHAMAKPPVPAASPEDLFQTIYREEELKFSGRLQDECQHLFDILDLRRGEVRYKTLIVPTPFTDSILQVIRHERIDLVVMGSRGSSGLKKLFLGSNTLELMRLTPVPLLVMPSYVVFDGFSCITVLLEQNEHAYRPGLGLLERLTKAYHAIVHYLVLTQDGKAVENMSELSMPPDQWQYLLQIPHTVSNIVESAVLSGLDYHMQQTGTNLLVLLPEKRSVWDSFFSRNIAEELAAQAKIPLLVLPSQA